MFRRRRPRAHSARLRRRIHRARRLALEPLEDRRLLAVVSVSNTNDIANAPDLTSIANLIANDGGDGISLREAITAANNTVGNDEIRFDNLPGGIQTITVSAQLPDITDTVTIDGYVGRAGATTNTLPAGQGLDSVLEIVITNGGGVLDGLRITGTGASGSIIRGLVINGFDDDGIQITDSNNNQIRGNYFGTNAAGNAQGAGGNDFGVFVTGDSTGNVIGGLTAASRNLISGNNDSGVLSLALGNTTIQGNLIGTNRAGTAAIANGSGIQVTSGTATIGGTTADARNVVSGNSTVGVTLSDVSNSFVQGNVIGLNVNGAALANGSHGVLLVGGATMNTVGGTTTAARNIISGNGGSGVFIDDADSNTVLGNFIGTSLDGTAARPNEHGVFIVNGSMTNTIGGTAAGSRNVISGNSNDGVHIQGDGTSGNLVFGNYIGLAANGSDALGNGDDGVEISGGATANRIGDNAAGARNVISANDDEGVQIAGNGTSGNFVQGNFIGTAANGTTDRGNTNDGVDISGGASNNLVGGLDPGDGNLIAFNDDGVVVLNGTSTGNKIQRNSIRNNTGLGIDLADDGVTPNDPGDGDDGPNLLQNFPTLISATLLGDSVAIRYRVNSAVNANATYPLTVEFFIADSDDQEGQTFLSQDEYPAALAQNERVALIPAAALLSNSVIVATATDAAGNTSEFSGPISIEPPVFLGSEPTVILPFESIGQDQTNFYQYIAHSTGKLIVRIDFLHAFGDLALQVTDKFGNVLAESDTSSLDQNFEEVILPVVAQQRYFVSITAIGFDGKQLQFYGLELENFPAPVPAMPDLVAASDTGMMNDDNITGDATPTFRIQADLTDFASMGIAILDAAMIDANSDGVVDTNSPPGAGVFVVLTNLDTGDEFRGFATRVNAANPRLWTFTVPQVSLLPDGEYFVSAAVQIVDGQEDAAGNPARFTGRSQLSPPLTIIIDTFVPNVAGATIDLLDYADSGMFDDDNVTNKMQPAFGGLGPANAKVHVFAQRFNAQGQPVGTPLLVGSGLVGSELSDGNPENALGLWEITVEPLADGKYSFFARFESLSGVISGPVGLSATKTNATAVAIPDPGNVTSTVQFAAADFPLVGNVPMTTVPVTYAIVQIDIEHTRDADLTITLIAPDNTEIDLSSNNGGDGDDYTNTFFDDFAITSITAGVAPFTGSFRPEQMLSLLNGKDAVGTWTLRVADGTANEQEGRLLSWSLTLFTPLMVVIDTEAPNTSYLDLLSDQDTGRNNLDNLTKNNNPEVTMTSSDLASFATLLFTDNLKFRIFDRYENAAEFLLYDSAQDTAADMLDFDGDMFTSQTFLRRFLADQFFDLHGTNTAVINVNGAGALADGIHNLKLEVEDRAGNISHDFLLTIVVDTTTPPVSFGLPDATNNTDGLAASSDTGVTTQPDTYADRVTSDTTPTFWGRAEANSIVRLYLDRTDVGTLGVIDLATDYFLGQTTAIPLDGNFAEPNGYWEITSILDLNQLAGLPKDGLRRLLVTAEDGAGNPMPMDGQIADGVASLQIFIDTQGPQIIDVNLGPGVNYDLFDPKPSTDGPTPLVHSLFIDVRDLPLRLDQAGTINDFLYPALIENIAETLGNYELIGDHVGQVIIQDVIVHFQPVVSGQPAFASIELMFAQPLPDDRYTLRVRDALVDPAGNRLDGESGNPDPFEDPNFPSGDGVPGGDFIARFTVDSRPEIGVWAAGIIHIDTNGNFVFDPENLDFTNRDLVYTLGFSSDYIFAGNFVLDPNGAADGFDKLAVYGRVGNEWRFLIDFNNDGVPDQVFNSAAINGIPVAGNFDGNAANGDEIGIFTGTTWYFDTNHNFMIDAGDAAFAATYAGFPVVGDFDGDGDDDVATYIASQAGGNFFVIDLNTGGAGPIAIDGVANHSFRVGIPGLGTFGFAGVRERPVAADMNGDGADDLGLWVPDGTAILPGDQGEWFFLLSSFERNVEGGGVTVTQTVLDRIVAGNPVNFVPFSTTPFGDDLYARFGNSFALPIVGNFDPPVTASAAGNRQVVAAPTPAATTAAAATSTTAAPASTAASVAAATVAKAAAVAPPPAVTTSIAAPVAATTVAASKQLAPAVAPAVKAAAPVSLAATSTKQAKAAQKLTAPKVTPAASSAGTSAKSKATKSKVAVGKSPLAPTASNVAKPGKSKKSHGPSATGKSAAAALASPKTAKASAVALALQTQAKSVTFAASSDLAVDSQPILAIAGPSPAVNPTPTATMLAVPAVSAPAVQPTRHIDTLADAKLAAETPAAPTAHVATPLAATFAAANDVERPDHSNSVLSEPALVDAAVADLRLTLADARFDALAATGNPESSLFFRDDRRPDDADTDDLAHELACNALALAGR